MIQDPRMNGPSGARYFGIAALQGLLQHPAEAVKTSIRHQHHLIPALQFLQQAVADILDLRGD